MSTAALTQEDRTEITDVLAHYGYAIDTREWDLLRHVFAPDATIEYDMAGTRDGVDSIVDFLRTTSTSVDATQHILGIPLVREATGGGAQVVTQVTAHHIVDAAGRDPSMPASPDRVFSVTGAYTDRFQRGPDGWRIANRRLRLLTLAGDPGLLTIDR